MSNPVQAMSCHPRPVWRLAQPLGASERAPTQPLGRTARAGTCHFASGAGHFVVPGAMSSPVQAMSCPFDVVWCPAQRLGTSEQALSRGRARRARSERVQELRRARGRVGYGGCQFLLGWLRQWG